MSATEEASTRLPHVRLLLSDIENLGVAKGAPFCVVMDAEAKGYALAQRIGDEVQLVSSFIAPGVAAEWALRALGGDRRAITHPRIIIMLATALLGMIAEGAEIKAEKEKTEALAR